MSQLGLGLGLSNVSSLLRFSPLDLDPYLLFDTRSSMIGTFENPTLDLDPSKPDTLNVITATRAGTATYTDANGVIQTASPDTVRVDYTQGEELTPTKFQRVGYTDIESNWNPFLGSTVEGQGLNGNPSYIFTSLGSYARPQIGVPTDDGQIYTGSFWARRVSGSSALLAWHQFSATGNSTLISVTEDWAYYSFQFLGRTGGGSVNFGIAVEASGDQIEIAMPQVEEGTTASDFVANTTGSPKFITGATYGPRVPMILVEPSAENLLEYSEDFSNSYWTKAAVLIESNQIEAPDGTLTGSKLIEEGADSTHLLFRAGLTTLGTISIYAKKSDENNRLFQIRRDGGSNSWSWFDLQAGTVEYQTNGVAAIESVGNGWYRCSFTPTNSNGTVVFGLSNGGLGRGEIWLGDGTSGVYIWGAQLEAGSVSTSVIPTSGSTVTRAADELVISGSDFTDFYNGSEGTFYIEAQNKLPEIGGAVLMGQSSTRLFFYKSSPNRLSTYDGGSFTHHDGLVANQLFNAAVTFNTSNRSSSLDGSALDTDTINTQWAGADILKIGFGYSNNFTGHFRRILYWPLHSDSL